MKNSYIPLSARCITPIILSSFFIFLPLWIIATMFSYNGYKDNRLLKALNSKSIIDTRMYLKEAVYFMRDRGWDTTDGYTHPFSRDTKYHIRYFYDRINFYYMMLEEKDLLKMTNEEEDKFMCQLKEGICVTTYMGLKIDSPEYIHLYPHAILVQIAFLLFLVPLIVLFVLFIVDLAVLTLFNKTLEVQNE